MSQMENSHKHGLGALCKQIGILNIAGEPVVKEYMRRKHEFPRALSVVHMR
ncbi:MAG: hypothetical protein IKP04_05185 [Candidatus Methanomethylophilaceae archaeon]|nr:hypothetical protein [Candidatus Methanomethylophilaceae archaeon]